MYQPKPRPDETQRALPPQQAQWLRDLMRHGPRTAPRESFGPKFASIREFADYHRWQKRVHTEMEEARTAPWKPGEFIRVTSFEPYPGLPRTVLDAPTPRPSLKQRLLMSGHSSHYKAASDEAGVELMLHGLHAWARHGIERDARVAQRIAAGEWLEPLEPQPISAKSR